MILYAKMQKINKKVNFNKIIKNIIYNIEGKK